MPIVPDADCVVYTGVVRVVAVVRSFESVSASVAAAAVVYVVDVGVVVAVPACCRPSAQNTRHKYIPGTTVISIFVRHTTAVRTTKQKWPFFCGYELTRRQGYSTRTTICIYMRCSCRCSCFAHYNQRFFPNSSRCSLRPAFLATPRQLSTAAAAVVVPTR